MAPLGSSLENLVHLRPRAKVGISWANVINARAPSNPLEIPSHLQKPNFDKIKASALSSVTIDLDLWFSARDGMQSSLYSKFLGKALPLN